MIILERLALLPSFDKLVDAKRVIMLGSSFKCIPSIPILLLSFFLFPSSLKGQENGLELGSPDIAFAAEPQVIFNFNDAYAGLNLGIMDHQNVWSLSTFFDARVFTRRTLIKRPEAYYQYKEWRGMFGFMLDKAFLPWEGSSSNNGFYVEGAAAYTFGEFRASSVEPTPAWFFYPGLGFATYMKDGGMVKFGVQWVPIPHRDEIAPLRVKFSGIISSAD